MGNTQSNHVYGRILSIDATTRIIKLQSQDGRVSLATYYTHETHFETLRDYFAQGYISVTYDIDLVSNWVATNVQIYRHYGDDIQIGGTA